jgi:hypothetical protein
MRCHVHKHSRLLFLHVVSLSYCEKIGLKTPCVKVLFLYVYVFSLSKINEHEVNYV